jgi:O-antigen ligase
MNTFEKYLSYGLYGVIFLIPFIPLIIARDLFFPFITGKNFAFRALVEIGFALYILRAILVPSVRPKKSWILILYSILLLVLLLSTVFGVDPSKSFWSNFERMEGFITHLHLFGYFFLLTGTLTTEKLWRWFFQTSLGVSILVSIYSIFQLVGYVRIFQSSERIEATFGNSTYLAVYLLIHIFIAAIFLFNKKRTLLQSVLAPLHLIRKKHNIQVRDLFYWGVIIFEFIVLLFTETRGAMVGLLAGVIVVAFLQVILGKGNGRKIAVGSLLGIIFLVGAFVLLRESDTVRDLRITRRLASISLTDSAVQARFKVWNIAYDGFKERPILGWGAENFPVVFSKFYKPELFNEEPWFDRAHNVFFDWLINAGIVGLLSYLSLFAAVVYYLLFRQGGSLSLNERTILLGLFAAYFAQNVFVFDNITSLILFVSLLGYVHSLHAEEWGSKALKNFSLGRVKESLGYYIAIPLVIIFSGIFYYVNVLPFMVARGIIVALSTQDHPDGPIFNAKTMEKVIDKGTFGSQEAAEQYMQIALSIVQFPNIDASVKQEVVKGASERLSKISKEHPLDARAALFYGSFLNLFQDYAGALSYLEQARTLSPMKQQVLFELGNNYLGRQDRDGAFLIFKEAYDLEPRNPNAQIMYAVGAIVAGKQSIADETLQKHFETRIVPDERLANAYIIARDNRRATEILRAIAEKKPELKDSIETLLERL